MKVKNNDGDTALIHAAGDGCIEIAELLVRSNTDVNVNQTMMRPLFIVHPKKAA